MMEPATLCKGNFLDIARVDDIGIRTENIIPVCRTVMVQELVRHDVKFAVRGRHHVEFEPVL